VIYARAFFFATTQTTRYSQINHSCSVCREVKQISIAVVGGYFGKVFFETFVVHNEARR
jgi:hypothetical protein